MFENRLKKSLAVLFIQNVISVYFIFLLNLGYLHAFPPYESSPPATITFSDLLFTVTIPVLLHASHYLIFYKTYHDTDRIPSVFYQILKSTFISLMDTALIYAVVKLFTVKFYTTSFAFHYMLFSLLLNYSAILMTNYLLKTTWLAKNNIRDILLVGSNDRTIEFAKYFEENKFLNFRIMGCIDDITAKPGSPPRIGSLNQFEEIIRSRVVDAVVITLPLRSFYDRIDAIITKSREQGMPVYLLSQIFKNGSGHSRPSIQGFIDTLEFYPSPMEDWKAFCKRIMDIAIALIMLIIFSPIMIIAALIIKTTSRGPVLFSQIRVGYHKRRFTLYKFRTMVTNAEEVQHQYEDLNQMDGPVFKIKGDPRITKYGSWMRKYGVDELPQLFNVLAGDMSIVGPRPLALRDYNGFSESWLIRRFSVKPGITCYWQCHSNRNDLSFEQWMKLDMKYIDNMSICEDIRILVKTIPAVLGANGE